MSPFFTLYGGVLLILQFLSGFKVAFDSLNFGYDRRTMDQIGIHMSDFNPAFVTLLVKVRLDKSVERTICMHIDSSRSI
jgi:hypothetical protein